jgi:hypothetical protein
MSEKVSKTLARLIALEQGQTAVRAEIHELRTDLNSGLGAILDAINRLNGTIERVAEIRPRLDKLEQRVATLEAR